MIKTGQTIWFIGEGLHHLESIKTYLEEEGFRISYLKSGEEAWELTREEIPQIILTQIQLPGLDGVESCRRLRKNSELENTLILFLTGPEDDFVKIAAFDAGADDFLTLPIHPRVLHYRLEALLKRVRKFHTLLAEHQQKLVIDPEGMTAIKNGKRIQWQNKEFELLLLLSTNPGKIFSREDIIGALWPDKKMENNRIIDVYVRRVREKIGEDHIITMIGKGYKFV